MCVAVCVLLAIIFVLSKGSGDIDLQPQQQLQQQNSLRSVDVIATTTPQIGSAATASNNARNSEVYPKPSMVQSDTTTVSSGANMNMVPEAVPESLAAASTTTIANTIQTEPVTPVVCPECPQCPSSSINIDDPNALMAKLRQDALDSTPPHIIECSSADGG